MRFTWFRRKNAQNLSDATRTTKQESVVSDSDTNKRKRPRASAFATRRRSSPPFTSWAFASVAVNAAAFRVSQTNKVQRERGWVFEGGAFLSPVRFAQVSLNRSRRRGSSHPRAGAAYASHGDSRSLQSKRITEKRLSCLRKISHGHRRLPRHGVQNPIRG